MIHSVTPLTKPLLTPITFSLVKIFHAPFPPNPPFHTPIYIHALDWWILCMDQFFLPSLLQLSQWLSAVPSFLIHTSIAQTSHSLAGAMHICSFRHLVDIQSCCSILKVTLNVTLLQMWVFLSNTNIAWSTEQSDEKCRVGPGHDRKAGNEWPTLAHEKTPVTVGGPLNEGSLRVWAVGQAKMIARKQAKPAGSAGASFHPGLTPSHDLLALMLWSVLLFSSSLSRSRSVIFTLLLFVNILLDFVCAVGHVCPRLCTISLRELLSLMWTTF